VSFFIARAAARAKPSVFADLLDIFDHLADRRHGATGERLVLVLQFCTAYPQATGNGS
jgi:hypothetical protein